MLEWRRSGRLFNQTVTAEIDEVQLPGGRYFRTSQLFELGERHRKIA